VTGGGATARSPAHGFPHWFQSPKKVSDTKRTKKFWVRKGKVRIQFKQKVFQTEMSQMTCSDAVKGAHNRGKKQHTKRREEWWEGGKGQVQCPEQRREPQGTAGGVLLQP